MKKLIVAMLALVGAAGMASAQYLCTEQGTVFVFSEKAQDAEGKDYEADYKTTVESVSTDADGLVSTRLRSVHKVPGNDLAEIVGYSGYTYNPADQLTVYIALTGEDYKKMIIDMIVDAARSAGQAVGESDIAELEKSFRVKGDLTLPLPENPDPAAKVPNKSIKISAGPQTMSMNLWEAKYQGFETVTVPAGTFENCLKVTYVQKINSPEGVEKKWCTSWFAKGYGEVKSTEADKKGNIKGETVLKEVKKP
ncbi:MAG: hypothetical protein NC418_03360 [Muribaculaceae bacterium]|nr:hypothetical protein [Muribaculaceae bacterium]